MLTAQNHLGMTELRCRSGWRKLSRNNEAARGNRSMTAAIAARQCSTEDTWYTTDTDARRWQTTCRDVFPDSPLPSTAAFLSRPSHLRRLPRMLKYALYEGDLENMNFFLSRTLPRPGPDIVRNSGVRWPLNNALFLSRTRTHRSMVRRPTAIMPRPESPSSSSSDSEGDRIVFVGRRAITNGT